MNAPNVTFDIDEQGDHWKHTLKMSNIKGVALNTINWPTSSPLMIFPLDKGENLDFIIKQYSKYLPSMALMLKVSRLVGDWDVFGDRLQNLILSNDTLFKIDGDMAFQHNATWAAHPLVEFSDNNYDTREPIVLDTSSKKAVIEVFKNGFAIAHKLDKSGSEAQSLVIYAMKSYFRQVRLLERNSRLSSDEQSKEWLIAAGISTEDSQTLVQLEFSFAVFDETSLSAAKSSISEKSFHILNDEIKAGAEVELARLIIHSSFRPLCKMNRLCGMWGWRWPKIMHECIFKPSTGSTC